MRPATWSTVARSTSSFSEYSSEQFSPTVPSMIRPWMPASIIRSMWPIVAGRFSDWSGWNWVVAAGKTPSHEALHDHDTLENERTAPDLTPPCLVPNEDRRSTRGREAIGRPATLVRPESDALTDPAPASTSQISPQDDHIGVAPAILAEELDGLQGSPTNGRSTHAIWTPTKT